MHPRTKFGLAAIKMKEHSVRALFSVGPDGGPLGQARGSGVPFLTLWTLSALKSPYFRLALTIVDVPFHGSPDGLPA